MRLNCWVTSIMGACLVIDMGTSHGQDLVAPPVVVLPQSIVQRSITAQGDVIRANAEAFREYQAGKVLYAQARQQLAIAIDMELDNYIKYAETYYDRRLTAERKKLELLDVLEERKDKYGELRDNLRQRLLNRLLSDRERQPYAIESGNALNKVLYALADTPVAYKIDLGSAITSQVDQRLGLDPDTLNAMRVASPGSAKQVAALTQPSGMDLSWWPDHLRQPEFDAARSELEDVIESVDAIAAGGDRIDRDTIARLKAALTNLSNLYYGSYPSDRRRHMSTDEHRQFLRTDQFLVRLHGDLQRIRDTGRCQPMGSAEPFDPQVHGRDALSLVQWMLDSGVKFSKAMPGDEGHYHKMFNKLADLYVMVSN